MPCGTDKNHGKVTGRRLSSAGAGVAGEKPWRNPGVIQGAQRLVLLFHLSAPSLLICRLEKRQYKTQSFKGREAEARITQVE